MKKWLAGPATPRPLSMRKFKAVLKIVLKGGGQLDSLVSFISLSRMEPPLFATVVEPGPMSGRGCVLNGTSYVNLGPSYHVPKRAF